MDFFFIDHDNATVYTTRQVPEDEVRIALVPRISERYTIKVLPDNVAALTNIDFVRIPDPYDGASDHQWNMERERKQEKRDMGVLLLMHGLLAGQYGTDNAPNRALQIYDKYQELLDKHPVRL